MGAISAGLPAIYLPAGPMLRGNWQGKTLGSGSDAWKYWDERRAGNITDTQWHELESGIARSYGTCMTMGTAATMMSIAEGLGYVFPAPLPFQPLIPITSGWPLPVADARLSWFWKI